MKKNCPNLKCAFPNLIIKDGTFKRSEDAKIIQRFRCKSCSTRFSNATFSAKYRQKKRRVNTPLLNLLSSGVSMRRSSLLLRINRKTVERKLIFLASESRIKNDKLLKNKKHKTYIAQIDDLITKENSKLKPLTISIAVDEEKRLILGAEVSQIPSFGHLAEQSRRKYGTRIDEQIHGLERLFFKIKPIVSDESVFKSDEHQKYPYFIKKFFPHSKHITYKSEKGCIVGQGELKKIAYDPLFTVNHTCAMLRANINRLMRKTWCTSKSPTRLKDHVDIFIFYYNSKLIEDYETPI